MKKINTSQSDFKYIINNDGLFIDKTDFIKALIDDIDVAILFARPRRFGKTLNMSMLKYFFDIRENSKELFKELNIMNYGKKYVDEMNKYPVISVTLKDLKENTYENFMEEFRNVIYNLYKEHKYLLEDNLSQYEREYFLRCYNGNASEIDLQSSLLNLSSMLYDHYGIQTILLLDEYDTPIIQSHLNGYYDKCIHFMRDLFSKTFKDNKYLRKGIITGILRASKEGLLSGANNIKVYNITNYRYREYFGFTEEEVKNVLVEYELSDKFSGVKKWYDGYNFCDLTIYNPWSILYFLDNPLHDFSAYWVNTGGTDLLVKLIYDREDKQFFSKKYTRLLEDGYVENVILNTNMDIKFLDSSMNTIWTFFMLAGYLTPKEKSNYTKALTLRVPNLEIRECLEKISVNWLQERIPKFSKINEYFEENNMELLKEEFPKIIMDGLSYYDVTTSKQEDFYHGFVTGMLYSENAVFKIKSNREAGLGRFDLTLTPIINSCKYAYVIEFKMVNNPKDMTKAIKEAFKQIKDKEYDAELKEKYEVNHVAIACCGKKVLVEYKKIN